MHYAGMNKCDTANGNGVRVTLFVSGCPHHCKNCFNPEAWDYQYGQLYTNEVQEELLDACKLSYIAGLTMLGGEPLAPQNVPVVLRLCKEFRKRFPDKNIWMWTGYVYENLTDEQKAVADLVDVLVDGPFIDELKDLSLKFRGSSNQRILRKVNGQFQEE